jgi:hypothetical protein
MQTIVHDSLHDPRMSSQPIHNFSTTLEVGRVETMNTTFTAFGEELEDRPRKRSVPPVHIPLLDFSKLNQPRHSVAKKEVPAKVKEAYKSDKSKVYQTIEPRLKSVHEDTHQSLQSVDKPLDLSN